MEQSLVYLIPQLQVLIRVMAGITRKFRPQARRDSTFLLTFPLSMSGQPQHG